MATAPEHLFISPAMFDAALEWLAGSADKLHICSEEPENYSKVVSSTLAEILIDWDTFEEPEDYGVVGRILIVLEVSGVGLRDGTAKYVALVGGNELLFVVPCTSMGYEVEIIRDAPLVVREWCIVIERSKEECEIPEE